MDEPRIVTELAFSKESVDSSSTVYHVEHHDEVSKERGVGLGIEDVCG